MFPKGPRFEPFKAPDVPGPNAYSIPQESVLDNYKRGAFLEKTDRFAKDKHPELPAPSTAKSHPAPAKAPTAQSAIEKYNALQKKVDELEKVHLEGKRTHQVELERLKQELSAALKSATETTERLDKQKKQNIALDTRLQEMKKASLADQSEIKDLRHKTRMLELERDKIISKQPDVSELKKSLATLEAKRKDELKDRDRRIAELERLVQSEKKKRELAESKIQESKRLLEEESNMIKTNTAHLEVLVKEAQSEAQTTKDRLSEVENEAASREDALVQRLEQHCYLLNTVVEQYGNLVSQSVSSSKHCRLQQDYDTLQIRQFRLERKLANSEAQVVELAHLIRQIKSENTLLHQLVSETLRDNSSLTAFDYTTPVGSDANLWSQSAIWDTDTANLEQSLEHAKSDANLQMSLADFYRTQIEELRQASSILHDDYTELQNIAQQRASDLSSTLASHEAMATRLESIQKEKTQHDEQLKSAMSTVDNLTATVAVLEAKLSETQEDMRKTAAQHAVLLKKEKDTVARLTSTVQKNRIAEDVLRAEIEQLTTELADAESYQESFYALHAEVERLVTRNQIAEEEADRISKFNAEILGHNNPAQRIMYVDRIRRELAEAKHKIAMLIREQENVVAQNDELQNEIDMYKSVQVPPEKKTRTNITRVARPPLVNLGNSLNSSLPITHISSGSKHLFMSREQPLLEAKEGDMTTDELM
ncbi:hypothetical protein JR316_0002223 [Psilocybe cubensis]|uniref:Uncharacterized protein n=2 Tax=Psilocybe cubensis TaxID=181762 RepID=A0ACB8HDT5_PSICU|nr:hypothetical protein JR316_0002223 [Psilocybe cubensis]KAH9485315.1 hypothetical protein JR316_0002223 [Psilocybe cubensis]